MNDTAPPLGNPDRSIARKASARLRKLLPGREPRPAQPSLPDVAEEDLRIIEHVAPYTMTSPERRYAVIEAVRYIVRAGIPGALVECGVWRGGSVMAMILTLQRLGIDDCDIWLYDTFEGMTPPTEKDRSDFSSPALATWKAAQQSARKAWQNFFKPEVFNEGAVRELLESTGYPAARLHFIRGPVENTLPANLPEQLALLRLDTDWYESTRHELEHLYPRLEAGGVLIVDDYGHWQGCRDAVDEYFARPDVRPVLLQRTDYTGRAAVKR